MSSTHSNEHERYVELCALYPTGVLNRKETAVLREHVETCEACRAELAEYRQLDQHLIPLLTDSDTASGFADGDFSVEESKHRLFAAIHGSDKPDAPADKATTWFGWISERLATAVVPAPIAALLLMAVIALSVTIGVLKHSRRTAMTKSAGVSTPPTSPSARSADAAVLQNRLRLLDDKLEEREQTIQSLNAQIKEQSRKVVELKQLLVTVTSNDDQARLALAAAQLDRTKADANRADLQAQLANAQTSLATLKRQLAWTEDQHRADSLESTTLQRRVDDLQSRINDKDAEIREQQSLLDSDRDIRELMGARELFIADVFDIDKEGKTKNAFGRVFYTKNKSLVFYAFDLDKQRGLRTDAAFQAWGINDANKRKTLNLGMFYMDSEKHRRWVLRFNDPAVLERINAVFVTVEPPGGSTKPSGRQLLYSYLQAQPNHP